MKYLNGNWLIKDGYSVNYAKQIYDTKIDNNKLTLYAPFQKINNMGDTLDGGLLTIEITTPRSNIITTKIYHYKGEVKKGPKFEINKESCKPQISINTEKCIYQSGLLRLEISLKDKMKFAYYFNDKLLTQSVENSKAMIIDDANNTHISDQFVLDVGEKIYGLGERFTNFVKNGQTVDIWNADGGTGTQQAYKNIPFYISNRSYGLFVNTPDKVSFEIGSEQVSRIQFSVKSQMMEYSVIGGNNLKNVLEDYTSLTGKPPLLPAWTFGLWLSTSFTTDYNEKTVLDFVNGMQKRDIPLSVFHFDCLWMKELEWCNFLWDKRKFPNPKKLLKKLKEQGLKICVWINPYISQKSPLFDEGMEKGYFIRKTNGDIWQWDKWQAGMAIVDFTNPDAKNWYQNKLKSLLDMGVDCFKTDFGERIPTKNIKYYDNSNPQLMHNYYTLLYNKVVYEIISKVKGKKEAVVFARSATVGSQKYPVHWGGDNSSNYPSMAESLRAGLSFGMSGFGYWAHDISGFEDQASPDLYNRWTQFGLLSSHSRFHGSTQYKVPWIYGEESVKVVRKFSKLKLKLLPYLMLQSSITHETGIPMMRSMILEFPNDLNTEDLDRQYMLGDKLLVAPIFNSNGNVDFYLPNVEGYWFNLLNEKCYIGGKWYNETYDYFNLPLLVRPNSILIMGNCSSGTNYDYSNNATIHLYDMKDGRYCQKITDNYGLVIDEISVIVNGSHINIDSKVLNDFSVVVHYPNIRKSFKFNGNQADFEMD